MGRRKCAHYDFPTSECFVHLCVILMLYLAVCFLFFFIIIIIIIAQFPVIWPVATKMKEICGVI